MARDRLVLPVVLPQERRTVSIAGFAQTLISLGKQISVELERGDNGSNRDGRFVRWFTIFEGQRAKLTAMKDLKNQGTKKAPTVHQGPMSHLITDCSTSGTALGVRFQSQTPTLGTSQDEADDADSDSSIGLTAAQIAFLSLRILPARLSRWQTATLLGITKANVSSLIKAGVLTPMNQGEGTTIYFALIYIMAVRDNYEKLFEITNTLIILDADKNARALEAKAKA